MIPDPRSPYGFTPEEIGPVCLVTGGSGYLAGFLIDELVAIGCAVKSFDLLPYEGSASVQSVVGDLRDYRALEAACAGVDVVFHVASLISIVGVCRPEVRRRVFDVNVVGTENVIRACRAGGVEKLIYTSSTNVVMDREIIEGDENCPYASSFVDLYSETKGIAEREVLGANDPQGLRTSAIRPGGIWGPGSGCMMIEAFVGQLATGNFKVTIGDGSSVVDNTHVYNVVDGHLLAARALGQAPQRVGGQAYFITDDERLNGVEWFRPLVEGMGYAFPTLGIPARLMYGIAYLMEVGSFLAAGSEPTLTRRGVMNLTCSSSFRLDKARRELGYEPRVKSAEHLLHYLPDVRAMHDAIQRGEALRDLP